MPSGRIRSPCAPGADDSSSLAERLRVERRQVRARGLDRARRGARRAPPSCPNRQLPGKLGADRLGRGVGLASEAAKRISPCSQIARTPPPRSTSPPSGTPARRMICGRAPRVRAAPRGPRRARRARAAPGGAGAGSEPASAVRPDRDGAGARARGLERLEHHPLEQLGLLGELGLGLGDVPLGRGVELAQHRQDLGADPVAREAPGRAFVSSSANGRPAAVARRAQSRARSRSSSGRTTRPLLRRQPAERPRPGRDGEPVEHRLGEVGARVAGGDPVAAGAGAEPLGGRVAEVPRGGLEVSVRRGPGALDVEVDPQPRAEVAGDPLVAVGATRGARS